MCHLLSLLYRLGRKAVFLLLSTKRISVETSNLIPKFTGSTDPLFSLPSQFVEETRQNIADYEWRAGRETMM